MQDLKFIDMSLDVDYQRFCKYPFVSVGIWDYGDDLIFEEHFLTSIKSDPKRLVFENKDDKMTFQFEEIIDFSHRFLEDVNFELGKDIQQLADYVILQFASGDINIDDLIVVIELPAHNRYTAECDVRFYLDNEDRELHRINAILFEKQLRR